MPNKPVKLSVIILFYHGEYWVDQCVHSLIDQTLSKDLYEIILVDNGGSTPSVATYKGVDLIKIVHFPVNYGFARGNNMAMEYANGEMILLMNQDIIVHKKCLEVFLNGFERYTNAGAISANMFSVSKEDTISRTKDFWGQIGYFKLSKFGYASYCLTTSEKDIFPVDFVSGNALGFRKSILKDIGNYLFDDRLGSYAEDLDFSIRLKNRELNMYVLSNAIVYHFRDQVFSGDLKRLLGKLFHVSANRLIVYYNNLTLMAFLKKLPLLLLGIPFKVAKLDTESRPNIFRFLAAFFIVVPALPYFGARITQHIFWTSRMKRNQLL